MYSFTVHSAYKSLTNFCLSQECVLPEVFTPYLIIFAAYLMNHILKWTININMNFTRTKRGDKSAYCWQYRVGRMTVSDERLYQCGGWFSPLKICRITKNEMALSSQFITSRILTLLDIFFLHLSWNWLIPEMWHDIRLCSCLGYKGVPH